MDRFSQTIISRSILLKLRSFFSQFLNGLCIIDRLAIKNNRIFPNSAIKTQYNINRARPIHIFEVYTDQKEAEKYYITLSMRLCEVWNRIKSTLNTAISTVPLKSSFKFDHDVKSSHCLSQGQLTARLTDGEQQHDKTQIVAVLDQIKIVLDLRKQKTFLYPVHLQQSTLLKRVGCNLY